MIGPRILTVTNLNQKGSGLVRSLLSLLLISLLLWLSRSELLDTLSAIKETKLVWFVTAFLLNLLIMIILSERMRLAFEAAGLKLSLLRAIQLTFIGYFFNNFLPTSAGGDFIKAYYGARLSKKTIETSSAVLADRIYGTYGLFLLATVGVALTYSQIQNELVSIAVIGITLTLTISLIFMPAFAKLLMRLFSRHPWLKQKSERISTMTNNFSLTSRYAAAAIANSIFTKFLSVVGVFMLTKALGVNADFMLFLWLVPLAFAVSLLPSINGLGFREGVFVVFLGPIIGADKALALAILWLGVYLITDIIGGLIYALSSDLRRGHKRLG